MRGRLTRVLLVAAFAVVAGHLAWNAGIGPPPIPEYFVEHNGPAFSAPDPGAKNLYLRRIVSITQAPRHAWLQVIARDRLRVYVNGELLEGRDDDGAPVGFVIDLARHLRIGSNVIAITARQASIGRPPVVGVRGEYTASDGQVLTIQPDHEWRAATRYEHLWLSPDFQDRHWPAPRIVPAALRSAVTLPPRAITTRSTAAWITPTSSDSPRLAMRRYFDIEGRAARAWLRLTTTGPYRVAINGVVVDAQEDDVGTDEPTNPVRRTYDVTTFVRRGSNVIGLLLTRGVVPLHVLADLEIENGAGSLVHVPTDSRWVSRSAPPADWLAPDTTFADAWLGCRVESGDVGFPPWALEHQHVASAPPVALVMRRVAGETVVIILIAVVSWLLCRGIERRVGRVAYLALLPATLGLAIAMFATHDPRISQEAVFRPLWLAVAALSIVAQWVALARVQRAPTEHAAALPARVPREAVIVAAVVAAAFWLRMEGVTAEPLQWDEVEHYEYTVGFWERGFPSREVHPDLPLAYVHTSELMFVPTAIAALVFDDPRYVLRAPAALFGTLSVLLIYLVGRRMFARSVGVLAAAVLALSPAVIAISTIGRYFAQLQFLTLLVVYALWLTVRGNGPVNRKALCVTAASFVAMYLTWEGAAFIAIGLMPAALAQRQTRLRTLLLNPSVWMALLVVAMALVLQYSHVVLQQTQFLWYGTSLSDLRIRPMWDYPTFRPWFYVWAASWSLDALIPMASLVAAVLLSARHPFRRSLRFLLLVYLTTCVFMASLLPAMAWRYVYHLVPLMVLLGSAAIVAFTRSVQTFARHGAVTVWAPVYGRAMAATVVFAFVLAGTGVAFELRELPWFRVEGFDHTRFKFPNLEGPSRYVRDRLQPGDVVLATDPFQAKHFMGVRGQSADPLFFWPASTLQLSATLDDNRPIPLDRRDGTPAVVDVASLERLFAQHERIWYIVQPERHENQNLQEVSIYLRQHMDVVHEDFEAVVLLRDRNHRRASARSEDEHQLGYGNRHRTNFPPEPRLTQ